MHKLVFSNHCYYSNSLFAVCINSNVMANHPSHNNQLVTHKSPQSAPVRRQSSNSDLRARSSTGRRFPLPHLPNYVFTERLGSGTYATVYKAFKKVYISILPLFMKSYIKWAC